MADDNEFAGKGTHAQTRGPCYGVNQETGERRWFPTRTRCRKAGFRWSESAWGTKAEKPADKEAA